MSNPFDRNPYRLPPPWNAGYALPQNVDDEGLERHAYTTAWAPRGSFDDPKVGTAGYAVPQYVKDEGYGVGAMTTRWAQRGSYAGPKVPHWLDRPPPRIVGAKGLPNGAAQIKLETMAGVELAMNGDRAPLTSYGLTSAKALIDTVKMMPPDIRKRQLKLALDKIDPKLYARAEADANKEAKLGVPADIALERGLAAAMAYGLAQELVDVSKGKPVGKKSQLGAACGLAMMGEDPVRAGFCWVPATASVPGHWERMRAGQTSCASAPPAGSVAPVVRDQRGDATGGGVTVTDAQGNVVKPPAGWRPSGGAGAPPAPPADQVMMNIGPFLIPTNVGAYNDHRALTAEKKAYVDENIAIAAKAGGVSIAEMKTGKYPFVKFKAGVNGEEAWGLYYREDDGTKKTPRGTVIPAGTSVSYHKLPANEASQLGNIIGDIGGAIKDVAEKVGGAIWDVLKKIWKGIKWVTMKIVHFVVDAAKWVAKQTCKLVSTPGVVQASQAVATAAPNPYTIGVAAGVTVTKMICDAAAGSGDPAADAAAAEAAAAAAAAAAEEEARKKKQMTYLLLGGAGVVGAILLLGGKKH